MFNEHDDSNEINPAGEVDLERRAVPEFFRGLPAVEFARHLAHDAAEAIDEVQDYIPFDLSRGDFRQRGWDAAEWAWDCLEHQDGQGVATLVLAMRDDDWGSDLAEGAWSALQEWVPEHPSQSCYGPLLQ